MSSTTSIPNVARKSRRRLAIWLGFAALGVSMGAVWATGFASIGGTTGTNPGATALPATGPASQPVSPLAGLATANATPWTVDWAGLQGSTTNQWFYQVDLSDTTKTPATNNYNIAMLLTNGSAVAGSDWSTLQMKVTLYDKGTSGTCANADFDGSHSYTSKLMTFDSQDAGAYWNSLPGGEVYCVGILTSNGQDTTGTFLRRSDSATTPVYPSFVATVDRTS